MTIPPATQFRSLINSGQLVMAPGAPDSLTARLVARAGFPAVYMTGFGATATRLGMPDIGLLTQTEMTEQARNMTRAVSIPVIADADTGYGGPSNVHRTVLEYQQAGVAAIHLEDQVAPKRCGQMAGIRLIDAGQAARTIELACRARDEHRGESALTVIARTDALPAVGMDEAVARVNRYREAGADMVFVDGVKTIAEVEQIARQVSGPKVISLVDGTEASAVSKTALTEMGFELALYAVTTLFAAASASQQALAALAARGGADPTPPMTYAQFCEVVDLPFHQGLDDRFGG